MAGISSYKQKSSKYSVLCECIDLLSVEYRKTDILNTFLHKGNLQNLKFYEAYELLRYFLEACGKNVDWKQDYMKSTFWQKISPDQRRIVEKYKKDVLNAVRDLSRGERVSMPLLRKSELICPGHQFMSVCLCLAIVALAKKYEKNGIHLTLKITSTDNGKNIRSLKTLVDEIRENERSLDENIVLRTTEVENEKKLLEKLEEIENQMADKEREIIFNKDFPEEFKDGIQNTDTRLETTARWRQINDELYERNSEKLSYLQNLEEKINILKTNFSKQREHQYSKIETEPVKMPMESELLEFKAELERKIMELKSRRGFIQVAREVERDTNFAHNFIPPLPNFTYDLPPSSNAIANFETIRDPFVDWDKLEKLIELHEGKVGEKTVVRNSHIPVKQSKTPLVLKEDTCEVAPAMKNVLNSTLISPAMCGNVGLLMDNNECSPITVHSFTAHSSPLPGGEGDLSSSLSLITEDELNSVYFNSFLGAEDESEKPEQGTFDSISCSDLQLSLEEPVIEDIEASL